MVGRDYHHFTPLYFIVLSLFILVFLAGSAMNTFETATEGVEEEIFIWGEIE